MRLQELALEYERSALMLKERIRALEQQRNESGEESAQMCLDRRLRPLRGMYRETRMVARYLKHYYDGDETGRGAAE